MDPLSLTASIIAVIGVGGQVAKTVRRLASLKGVPDLILALNNEIADLHLVVVAAQDVLKRQRTSGVPSPHHGAEEFDVEASVTNSLRQANNRVIELETLYKCLSISVSGSNAQLNKIAWLRECKRVKRMQEDFRSIRLQLAAAIGVLNSSTLLRLETGIHGLRTQLNNLQEYPKTTRNTKYQMAGQRKSSVERHYDESGYTQTLYNLSESTQDRQSICQDTMIYKPIQHLATAQHRFELTLDDTKVAHIAKTVEALVTTQLSGETGNSTTTINARNDIRISASLSYQQCEESCSCVCHHRITHRTPQLLDRFLGILFIGYVGIPYMNTKCDALGCINSSNPIAFISYFFPSWFLARAFMLVARFSPISGPEINIRVPRIINSSSTIFELCNYGDVEGVKALFRQGLGSPFDVESVSGRMPIHIAAQRMHIELCQFLLHAGADPYVEDFNAWYVTVLVLFFIPIHEPGSLSLASNAIDRAWIAILSNYGDICKQDRLRALFPGDDYMEKQKFSLLHKAVLGLNPLPLDALLASLNSSSINECDSWGRTALWWAVKRADYRATSLLLKHGADHTIKSRTGWGPLATAIFTRDRSCINLLLNNSMEANDGASHGWLPLHVGSLWGCDIDILEAILIRTADINAVNKLGETALMLAAQEDRVEICRHLISHKADLDVITADGESALHIAIRSNSHEALQLLLHHQADSCLKTYAGETLIHYAAQFGDLQSLTVLYHSKIRLGRINTADAVTGSSPRSKLKNLKGLTALQIGQQRRNESSEWLMMFRKLILAVEDPQNMIPLSSTGISTEGDDYEDALEYQG